MSTLGMFRAIAAVAWRRTRDSAGGDAACRRQQQNAKIGLFLELTGGSASTTSEASQFGVELAVQEINAAGGIGGRKLQLVVADTQTDPTVGVGEMKRLVQQEKVEFVFGPVISQILLAAAPVVNEAKIGTIGSTGSLAITPKFAPYYFSTLINAETQAKHMAAQAGDVLKAKSVAILSIPAPGKRLRPGDQAGVDCPEDQSDRDAGISVSRD